MSVSILTVPNALNLYASNVSIQKITINDTSNATSTSSGSLVINGGMGIKSDLRVGGTIYGNISGTIAQDELDLNGTTNSTSTSSGTLTVGGGVGIGKDLYVGSNIYNNGSIGSIYSNIIGSTNTTSTSTGSLVVNGGVGIGKDLRVGGTIYGNLNGTITQDDLTLNGTKQSTSTSTGSLIVNGGAGFAKSLYSSNITTTNLIINGTNNSTNISSGSLIVNGGVGINDDLYVGSNIYCTGSIGSIYNNVAGTADATSTSTGSIVISGGTGIGKNIYIGGICKINNTIDSSGLTTGALIVSGGVGCSKTLRVGTGGYIYGGLTVSTGQFNVLATTSSTSATTGAAIVAGGMGINGMLCANHLPNIYWIMGQPSTNSNTNTYFTLNPDTGAIGSRTILDTRVFNTSYPQIRYTGSAEFGALNAEITSIKLIFTIDSTPYTLYEGVITMNSAITSSIGIIDVVYKFIPITGSTFDIRVIGYTNFPDTGSGGANAFNVKERPIITLATNGGSHFTRGTNYILEAQYKFTNASASNFMNVMSSKYELTSVY